ncbi:MAG: cell division protein FtsQ/DivIB [Gammaproteobacteria bacterium]|nr:cell division protein FtsQ/DivIB [Gammaproteobacteria bacterium]
MKFLKRRKSNRKVEKRPLNWQRPASWLAVVLVLGVAGHVLFQQIVAAGYEEFRYLEVQGELNNVSVDEVQRALAPHIEKGFLDFDIEAAKAAVVDLPWVRDASLRRGWPGVLHVQVIEEQAVASWFGTSLLNADGEVFVDGAVGYSGVLPDVGGPAGRQGDVLARLAELREFLGLKSMDLRRLYVTDRRAERFWLGNGIEVRLGRRDHEVRLQRFVEIAWPTLAERLNEIEYIDMRYTNGFAVGWKAPAADDANDVSGETGNVQENG